MTMLANKTETRALTLADYEARIHLYKEQGAMAYIGIGRTLTEAKEAGVVPHGQWETWVQEVAGFTPRQAQRCMQVAEKVPEGSAMAKLDISKALLLISSGLDTEEQEAIAEKAAEENPTVKELKEQLKQEKLKRIQETGAAVEIREALKKAEEDRERLEQQLRATESAYKIRINDEKEDAFRRGEMAGSADAAAEIRRLRNDLEGNRQQRQSLQDQLKNAREAADRKAFGLQNELNKQKQYAESLREELEKAKEAPAPESFAKDREILIAAAEDAEKRAAEAEAQLEALKAGNGEDRGTVADKINSSVYQFLSVCGYMTDRPEVLQRVDAQSARNILCGVDILQAWCEDVYNILEGTVEGEGAVE